MKIASEVSTRKELESMKSVMEVFVVANRIHRLAELSIIYNLSDYFEKIQ